MGDVNNIKKENIVKKEPKFKHLKQEDFDLVKTLQKHGLSSTEVMKVTKRGAGTVSTIGKVNTFEEYVAMRKRENDAYKAARTGSSPTVNVELLPVSEKPKVSVNIKQENDIANALLLINNTLQQLVECFNAEPKKKGLFK